ncbi:MAG: hypothetical protein E6Q58_04065 [Niabella sp.]|nr:MAG: hypothetical protein E6Q58_04065 [Niabella sp.]
MFKSKILDKKEEIINICKNNNVSFIGLFGSVARNEDTLQSDIDFYVKFNQNSNVSLFDIIKIESDLSEVLEHKVDLVTNPNPFVLNSINKDLIKIYERA